MNSLPSLNLLDRSRKSLYAKADSQLVDFGVGMTVCIASLAPPERMVVAVCDRMISTGFTSSDKVAIKIKDISLKWFVMFAGNDISPVHPIAARIADALTEYPDDIQLETVVKVVCAAYQKEITLTAERHVLSRYGLDMDKFTREGFAMFGERQFDEMVRRIEAVRLELELLVTGFDDQKKPHIFTVSSPGVPTYHDAPGFAAIGSGDFLALGSLYGNSHTVNAPTELILYRLLEAKFVAESAVGVGRDTVVMMQGDHGFTLSITKEHVAKIRNYYEQAKPKLPSKEVIHDIRKMLVEWTESQEGPITPASSSPNEP